MAKINIYLNSALLSNVDEIKEALLKKFTKEFIMSVDSRIKSIDEIKMKIFVKSNESNDKCRIISAMFTLADMITEFIETFESNETEEETDIENIVYVYEYAQNDDGMNIFKLPKLDELNEEENNELKRNIIKNYSVDIKSMKYVCLYNSNSLDSIDQFDLRSRMYNNNKITDDEFDRSDNEEYLLELIEEKFEISEKAIAELKDRENVYINNDDEIMSQEEAIDTIDLDDYLSESHIVSFYQMRINDKFVYQKINEEWASDPVYMFDYIIITRESLKEHLENHKSVKMINSHDSMFGGSHLISFDESNEWKCYGSGPNWNDQNNDFSLQNIDDIIEYLFKNANELYLN